MTNLNYNTSIPQNTPPAIDAVVKVTISSDGLQAFLEIQEPENGGQAPTLAGIQSALEKANVTFGVKQDLVQDLVSKPTYHKSFLIAEGTAPVNGKDGSYELLFNTSDQTTYQERSDGTIDFYNLNWIQNVSQNDVVCRITLPTEGSVGTTVTGAALPPVPGRPVPNLMGKNTALSEDGTEIFATIQGHVTMMGQKINVNDTLMIRGDVNMSTGNITTQSSVVISGTITPGFSVHSEGDVQVGTAVSGASITAKGNVTLRSGIISGKVSCNGNLIAKFIENCEVFTKGNLKSDYILNSNITCAGNVHIEGQISKIVGGSCIAGEDIRSRTIGSSSNIRTYLEIGTDPTMINRQQELKKQIPELEHTLSSLHSLIDFFKQYEAANRLTEDKRKQFTDAVYSYQSCSQQLQAAKDELNSIIESIKKRGYGKIYCTGTIYPETTIKIGMHRRTIQQPLVYRSFYYEEDGIAEGTAR